MSSYLQTLAYFFRLPFHIQWRTCLVQIPRYVPLSILHLTSPKGPQPFIIALPSRKNNAIPIYVFVPPRPVDPGSDDCNDLGQDNTGQERDASEWKVPVVLDFHGGGFIMGSPLEQAPYAAMMSRELGAVVVSVSYRIGPFHQFPAAIHDAEDVLSAILDQDGVSKAGHILRTEIQRYYTMMGESARGKKGEHRSTEHLNYKTKITLDPTRLTISGFSAGGNIALNMAMSVPPCSHLFPPAPPPRRSISIPYPRRSISVPNPNVNREASTAASTSATESSTRGTDQGSREVFSPLLPPVRAPTKLDDPDRPWPSLLPPVQAQPRMLPLLLFYPSLDARLLPHERPTKPLPNALKPDDKKAEKAKMPGLFSIMGPTYLPKRLRAHPRASPGLVDPENVARNAAIFLVLPEKDSLAVQSDIWVDKMNESGWEGPVRFGDGRSGDWDGKVKGNVKITDESSSHGDADGDAAVGLGEGGAAASTETPQAKDINGGLEVWHAPKCRHGWTQFPEAILGKHEKRERELVFERTLDFVKESWKKCLPVESLGNRNQELRRLSIPTPFEGLPPARHG